MTARLDGTILGLIALALNFSCLSKAEADQAIISSVRVGSILAVPNNNGDTWVPAWARDGTIYSPSNDSAGFKYPIQTNIHFNKITGENPRELDGETVNPMVEYGKNGEYGPIPDDGPNHSYGPVSFLYDVCGASTQGPNERNRPPRPIGANSSLVTAEILGHLRNDFPDYVGCKFTTAASALIVHSLGRWVAPGNTGSHRVEIVDSANNTIVASTTVNTSDQTAGKFAYAALSIPATLAPNHAYYLLSLETKSGDRWYHDDTALTPSGNITINHSEFHTKNVYLMDGRTWKSSGCLALNGALYWVIARHQYGGSYCARQTARDASIIKSLDGGKTWTRATEENLWHPLFPGSRFATPYFVDYGQDGHQAVADGSDRYIYAFTAVRNTG